MCRPVSWERVKSRVSQERESVTSRVKGRQESELMVGGGEVGEGSLMYSLRRAPPHLSEPGLVQQSWLVSALLSFR